MRYRSNRLSERLRIEISEILAREFRDDLRGLVTISSVEVSPDLRRARVNVSCFGSPAEKVENMKFLTSVVGRIRRMVGARVRLRHTPELVFTYDESIEQGDRMVRMIEELDTGEGG